MEEKEIKPKMTVEQPKKMSYEELEGIAHQLSEQARNLHNELMSTRQKLNEMNAFNMFKRLDYLFKVLENESKFASEFVETCSDEIVEILTLPDEDEQTEEASETPVEG